MRYDVCQFYLKVISTLSQFQLSQRCNLYILSQHTQLLFQAQVDAAYKRKFQKLQPIDLGISDRSRPNSSDT